MRFGQTAVCAQGASERPAGTTEASVRRPLCDLLPGRGHSCAGECRSVGEGGGWVSRRSPLHCSAPGGHAPASPSRRHMQSSQTNAPPPPRLVQYIVVSLMMCTPCAIHAPLANITAKDSSCLAVFARKMPIPNLRRTRISFLAAGKCLRTWGHAISKSKAHS